ncbi:GspH/FimT family pseudopilin [Oleiagrimonas sp. C23AA]|uniref:GspH/FimT family pseudopilin n=1 Tax=Oleiagrimonas sp. C23AA TaxID=2719047 RepID=UPI001424A45D|nr:GspH/FimT family pseudopilin [Oleiagrimonas sp. C23AA]NII12069.1 prepilin-type N-terminal cleavage/methylation domain-containing protein [Oleiagrimonas sp. C23AA]
MKGCLSARRGARGFTLLEMLAVILLIGIAATVVSVSISHGLSGARVRAAGSDLSAALRYTRAQAIVHRRSEVLRVDVAARSYQAPGRPAKRLPSGMALKVTSASGDQQGGHLAGIRFFPDGSSTGGRITLRRGAREWHVNVAWLTGAIEVKAVNRGGA